MTGHNDHPRSEDQVMTKAEIRKLDTIIGKLEALQNQTTDARARDLMGQAKTRLMDALSGALRP